MPRIAPFCLSYNVHYRNFFTADRYNEQGELIAKGGFDLARFERALKARNIDELTSGYQIDFIGKDYAKKTGG